MTLTSLCAIITKKYDVTVNKSQKLLLIFLTVCAIMITLIEVGAILTSALVQIKRGLVLVSTGVLKMEKLSAGDASNRESKYKRRRRVRVSSLVAARQP